MNIERGDLFVVTRGYQLGRMPSLATMMYGAPDDEPKEPQYDRSHQGRVFRAVEVCGPVIAARIIYDGSGYRDDTVGAMKSINTAEVEVWPVTEAYLQALQTK